MAALTRGRYTYGSQTWANIILITGANIGDTVWDTTYQKRRMWDGNNFVHANQKSMVTTTGLLDGAVVVSSNTVDNQIKFQALAADTEGIIGIVENGKGNVIGVTVPMTYHGDVRALVVASGGGGAANPGDYVKNDTTNNGYANTAAPSAGTFAHYMDAAATTTGLRRILFRPVERN
jgi:hypothetical protein